MAWSRVKWEGEKQHTEGSITSESCPWKTGPAVLCRKKEKRQNKKYKVWETSAFLLPNCSACQA